MAKGQKRHRSLFELMDPKGVYRAPALGGGAKQEANQPKAEAEVEEEAAVEEIEAAKPAEEVTEQVSAEPEPVVEEEIKRPAAKAEADSELASEPIVTMNDGKVRLVTNYPLAAMLCFAAVVLLICAVLVGWRLGHDSAIKKVTQAQKETREEIREEESGGRSWFENE